MIAPTSVSVETRLRIEDFYAEYAACLDEGRYDEWPEFFVEDCTYRVVPRENYDRGLPLSTLSFESKGMLRDRVYGITQTLFHEPYYQRHFMSHLRITPEADGYAVRANYLVVRTKYGRPLEVYNAGRCIDRLVDDGGALRLRERICVFDSELIANSLIYPL